MNTTLAEKEVLILSDNEGLSRAIELNLKSHLSVKITKLEAEPRAQPSDYAEKDFDLMVVALSSHKSEPVVALAGASLAGRVGQVPLLIISDRPFHPDPSGRIVHLDFPFDVDRLHYTVSEILWGAQDAGLPEPQMV
jgi:hypothetical protein